MESYIQYFHVLYHHSDHGRHHQILRYVLSRNNNAYIWDGMFLVGTTMLTFGMGLHVMFVGSLASKGNGLPIQPSNFFGLFYLKGNIRLAIPYGGWESPDQELRGHFVGRTLEADPPQYAACRSVLRAGPTTSLCMNTRAVAQYADEVGNDKTATNDVDQCLRALEELDIPLLHASRNEPEASVISMMSNIGIAIAALNITTITFLSQCPVACSYCQIMLYMYPSLWGGMV